MAERKAERGRGLFQYFVLLRILPWGAVIVAKKMTLCTFSILKLFIINFDLILWSRLGV